MAEVKVGENESIESALRRFKKKIQKAKAHCVVSRKKFKKPVFFQKLKNAKDTKNRALKENVNQKLLVNVKYSLI